MEVLILILIGAPLAFYSWRYFQRERDEKIVAEGMEAIARLNKDIFEERGHRLEFEKQPDGETKLVYRKIWPDEEIERKAQEDGEAMRNVIGTNLLKSKSDAAKELISFLNDMYQAGKGKEIETPSELGQAWLAYMLYAAEEPDSEIAKKFNALNDAMDTHGSRMSWLRKLFKGPKNTNSGSAKALIRAAEAGDIAHLEVLFAQGIHVDAKDEKGLTALMVAAKRGDTAMVEALLAHGADVNAMNQGGLTALWAAAGWGHTATVEALLAHGADVNARDRDGSTALWFAAGGGHTATVEALLTHGTDVNARDQEGRTLLWFAAMKGDTATVEALLTHGADVNARDQEGATVLWFAAVKGDTTTVEALLAHGADVNTKAEEEWTALRLAASEGHAATVEALLAHGASVKGKDGSEAL